MLSITLERKHLLNDKLEFDETKKNGGNSNELVIYVYDLVDAWKSIIVTTRQRFWFLDFWNALLCVPPRRNQKRCHVFKIDESFGGNVAVNETLWEWHSKERREAWVPVLRCMLVTEELLEGDSHPRLVSSWKKMPCYIAWHIVLLAEFQYVVKLWQLWELKTWHHRQHVDSFIDVLDVQSCSIQRCHNNALNIYLKGAMSTDLFKIFSVKFSWQDFSPFSTLFLRWSVQWPSPVQWLTAWCSRQGP